MLKLVFDIEIVLKTKIAYCLGHAWGALGYKNEANYIGSDQVRLKNLLDSIGNDILRPRELFVSTHIKNYGGNFPIWAAVELMTFGSISKIYSYVPPKLKSEISNQYKNLNYRLLVEWLHCVSALRNLCAHNSRLYAKRLVYGIKIEKEAEIYIKQIGEGSFDINNNSLFSYLLAIKRISRPAVWNEFMLDLSELIDVFKDSIALNQIGFPSFWQNILGKN